MTTVRKCNFYLFGRLQSTIPGRYFRHAAALGLVIGLSCFAFSHERTPTDFLATHCFQCHDAATAEGQLNLSETEWLPDVNDNFALWTQVYDIVSSNQMPPSEEPQPTNSERNDFLNSLREKMVHHQLARQEAQGRVVLRRLNRFEYANSLRDLLGVSTPLEELLPEDGRTDGFETVGASLDLSVAHLDRYLEAAERALLEATATTRSAPTTKIRTDYEETWHDYNHGFQNIQWANAEDGNLAIGWTGSAANGTLRAWHPPIPDARYRVRFRARAMMQRNVVDEQGEKKKVNVHDRNIIARVGIASLLKDGLAYSEEFFELSPHEYREFAYEARVPEGHSFSIVPYRLVPNAVDDRVMSSDMFAVVDWVEIEGPLYETPWPPRGHRLMYGELPMEPLSAEAADARVAKLRVVSTNPELDARRLISEFLPRAFRRQVEIAEIDAHMDLFREQLELGRPFDAALRAAYKMALTSPQFLFLREAPGKLQDHALAARLSYGLWGSLPDRELQELADAGCLTSPAALRQQTERLLSAPRAERFYHQFLGGWLNLRDIDFTQPDTKLYPEFDSYLQSSMVAEAEQFFEELVRHNLSVSHILDSDFAFCNERLAEHYDLTESFERPSQELRDDVFPPERMRLVKVALPPNSKRGGFITQGAILKVSANGTTTSPVVRGAYLLDRILGMPPDPPPKNVPAVEPDIRGSTTIRQQLDLHRNQPACAACHAKLDPPGFALENYDATGRWRTHYRVLPDNADDKSVKIPGSGERVYKQGLPVEANYSLPDGSEFSDIDEYKQLVLRDPRQIARGVVRKLITYLTGAAPDFADRDVVEQIVEAAESSRYGMRDLIHGVIQSRVFTCK